MQAVGVLALRAITLSLAVLPCSWIRAGEVQTVQKEAKALTFSLQERVRGEWRENNFDFDDDSNSLTDDEWLVQRLRLGLLWEPAPWFRLMVEGQDTREFFSDRPNEVGKLGAEGDDAFDLRQGYLEVGQADSLSLRVGRQVLVYGDKRLISSGEWGNPSRVFDAVKLHLQRPNWWLDAFVSSVVQIEDGRFNRSDWINSETDRDQLFGGLYFGTNAFPIQTTEAYLLGLQQDQSEGDTSFLTLGTRMKADPAKLRGWEYDVEMAAQTGEVLGRDHAAFAGHWGLSYTWMDHAWKPRVGMDFTYASGDDNAADGESGTFQNLFPTNHLYYGYMDLFAWQNLRNPAVHFEFSPHQQWRVSLNWHWFWLDDSADAWYRASIRDTARPIDAGADSYAGSELDLTILWKAHQHLDVQLGYSRFFAGNYLSDTGSGDDAHFAYLMLTINY